MEQYSYKMYSYLITLKILLRAPESKMSKMHMLKVHYYKYVYKK